MTPLSPDIAAALDAIGQATRVECGFPRQQLPGGEDYIPTTHYLCQVGHFHWNILLDGECPNHGFHRTGPQTGPEGPYNADEIPYLGCCSVPA